MHGANVFFLNGKITEVKINVRSEQQLNYCLDTCNGKLQYCKTHDVSFERLNH